jgi:hypothetical protein
MVCYVSYELIKQGITYASNVGEISTSIRLSTDVELVLGVLVELCRPSVAIGRDKDTHVTEEQSEESVNIFGSRRSVVDCS